MYYSSKKSRHRILNLKELIEYRDLFIILAYRDFRVRYAQTFLGLLWAFIQPLATLLIFIVVFGMAIKVETEGIPYPLFAICGMAPWTYFSFVLGQAGSSVIASQEMVKKIYFPRLVIPLSKSLVGLVDFVIALVMIVGLMLYYSINVSYTLVYFPLYVIAGMLASLSLGIWLSALTIRYRDFQHVLPFLVQFGLYATPIAYPSSAITSNLPDWATVLFYLNPAAGIVEGFRWCLLESTIPSIQSFIFVPMTILLLVSGLVYFRKVERTMADLV